LISFFVFASQLFLNMSQVICSFFWSVVVFEQDSITSKHRRPDQSSNVIRVTKCVFHSQKFTFICLRPSVACASISSLMWNLWVFSSFIKYHLIHFFGNKLSLEHKRNWGRASLVWNVIMIQRCVYVLKALITAALTVTVWLTNVCLFVTNQRRYVRCIVYCRRNLEITTEVSSFGMSIALVLSFYRLRAINQNVENRSVCES